MNCISISAYLDAVRKNWEGSRHLFPKNSIPHFHWPIPFFGNPIAAKVATIAVNPSSTEFRQVREWAQVTSPKLWKSRLRDYFKHSIPPHEWFERPSAKLAEEFLSYRRGSVFHLDVSYRPTIGMLRNPRTDRYEFGRMVERDVSWMFRLLSLCPKLKELRTIGPIVVSGRRVATVLDFVVEKAPLHGFAVRPFHGGYAIIHGTTSREFLLRPLF